MHLSPAAKDAAIELLDRRPAVDGAEAAPGAAEKSSGGE